MAGRFGDNLANSGLSCNLAHTLVFTIDFTHPKTYILERWISTDMAHPQQTRDDSFGSAYSFVSYAMGMYTYALHRAFVVGTGWAGALRWDKRLVLILVFANCVFAPLDLADAVARLPTQPVQAGLRVLIVIVAVGSVYTGWLFRRVLMRVTAAICTTVETPSPSISDRLRLNELPNVFMKHLRNNAPAKSIATLRWLGWMSVLSYLSWQVEGAALVLAATQETKSDLPKPLTALANGCNFGVHATVIVVITMYRLVQVYIAIPV